MGGAGVTHGSTDPQAPAREGAKDIAPDESGGAENGNEAFAHERKRPEETAGIGGAPS